MRLRQCEQLKHLIQRAKATRKDDQRFCQVSKPVLAHEEIVELEIERRRDVLVRSLLKRQLDIQPDRFATGFFRSAVGCFHDAGASAGGDDKTMTARLEGLAPLGQ